MNELPTVLGIVPLVPIVIVCYLLGSTLKALGKDSLDKFIPIICGVFGGLVGIVVFLTIPGYLSATNWLDAFAVGAASGLVAVGINQIYKQFTKVDEEYVEGPADDEEPVPGDPGEEA